MAASGATEFLWLGGKREAVVLGWVSESVEPTTGGDTTQRQRVFGASPPPRTCLTTRTEYRGRSCRQLR
ncbi:hypothetical protein SBV1_3130003 [Verrucomicrobia bacterium]|nr:hypothetical protein SBV1_3130003 [Verrucomicrobiota bacterium]